MIMIKFKYFLCFGLLSSLLVGCGNNGTSDLEAYVDTVKARAAPRIEPLPEPKVYLPFSYSATFLRDPFQSQDVIPETPDNPAEKCTLPDLTRPKGYLEGFDISAFAMVGTIENDKEYYALVRVGGSVHLVKVGDYIGINHGEIMSIDDFRLMVLEKISNGEEGCTERPYTLELKS